MFSLFIILMTLVLVEFATVITRFTFKISSKETYIKIMKKFKLKRFYHFHHLFLGIIMAIIFYIYQQPLLFNIGVGVFASDVVHHLVVLWAVVGNPEFHIVYKNIKSFEKEELKEQKKLKRFFKHLVHHA